MSDQDDTVPVPADIEADAKRRGIWPPSALTKGKVIVEGPGEIPDRAEQAARADGSNIPARQSGSLRARVDDYGIDELLGLIALEFAAISGTQTAMAKHTAKLQLLVTRLNNTRSVIGAIR